MHMSAIAILGPVMLVVMLWLAMSAIVPLLYLAGRNYVDRIEPAARRRLLLAIAFLPHLTAVVTTLLVLAPAIPLTPEHCHAATGCGAHSPMQLGADGDGWLFGMIASTVLGVFVCRLVAAVAANWHCHRLLRNLVQGRDARGFWIIETERALALSAGIWKGDIYISSGLIGAIGEAKIQIVADHEASHVQRHDNLIHFLVPLLFSPISAFPAHVLLRDIRNAAEQVADRAAAKTAGAEIVAETLVRVHRLELNLRAPHFAYFNPHFLERRVAELFKSYEPSALGRMAACAVAVIGAASVLAGVDIGHHLMEDAIEWAAWVHGLTG